ncbi:MAG: hypothetical protein ACLUNZ_00010 [Evtepia sp.]
MEVTKGRAVDHTGQLELTFFNQSYVRRALHPGQAYVFYGQVTGVGLRRQMTNPALSRRAKENSPAASPPSILSLPGSPKTSCSPFSAPPSPPAWTRSKTPSPCPPGGASPDRRPPGLPGPSTFPPPGRTCKQPAAA